MAALLCIAGMFLNLSVQSPAPQIEPPKPPTPPPPQPPEPLSFLQLPDELLLKVARCLERNIDLRQLSLTSRKLRDVAQEALVKELVLPNAGIRPLLETLCNRPDLCEKVTHIDIGQFIFTGRTSPIFELEKWRYYSECRKVAGRKHPGQFDNLGQALDGYRQLWPDTQLFFLDMLVLMCSNLRRLSMMLPRYDDAFRSHDLNNPEELWAPFPAIASKTLALVLKTLTIAPTDSEGLLITPMVSFRSLAHVTCLRIPSTFLYLNWTRTMGSTFMTRVLPPNLQSLQLVPCGHSILEYFVQLADCLQNAFPHLEQLDLYFKLSMREIISRIAQLPVIIQDFLDAGNGLIQKRGTQIRVFDYRKGAYIGEFMDELSAWLRLSDLERWYPSRETDFASIVARTDQGLPRERTKEEVRMFLRRRISQAATAEPFSFTPKVRFDKCGNFYHSTPEGHCEIVFSDDFINFSRLALTQIHRPQAAKGRVILSRRLHGHRVQRLPITASQGKFTFRCTNSNDPSVFRFDPKKWLGVTFFDQQILGTVEKESQSPKHRDTRKRKYKPGQPVGMFSRYLPRRVKAKLPSEEKNDEKA